MPILFRSKKIELSPELGWSAWAAITGILEGQHFVCNIHI
jgi:hypothetical protein